MSSLAVLREDSIDRYMAEIRRYPLLKREEEVALARRYHEHGDVAAAHRLVVSNLRFVVQIAHEYKSYGVKLLDLIQEGNLGLMMAVKKFDPEKGYRLISYAVWWIRASMRSYIARSWSVVKLSTHQARKLLFTRKALPAAGESGVSPTEADATLGEAPQLDPGELRQAARDFSLDARLDDEGTTTHLDLLASELPDQESRLGDEEERELLRHEVRGALEKLSDRERYIVEKRMLTDEPQTLQEIGEEFQLTRERVRQIESGVVKKLRAQLEPKLLVAAPG